MLPSANPLAVWLAVQLIVEISTPDSVMEAAAQTLSCCGAAIKDWSNARVWLGVGGPALGPPSPRFHFPPSAAGLSPTGWTLARTSPQPLLRQRLQAVISVIDEQLRQPGQSLEHLMGSGLDAAKTVSSLTLFEAAGLDSAGALLDQIGRRCERTLEQLS